MIDTPRILQTTAQPTAIIRVTIPRDQIQAVMGPGIGELRSTLEAQRIVPTGPWFTHHLRMDRGVFDFEIGLPVPAPVAAEGRVANGQLPASTVARTIYHGPYEGLSSAWREFDAWIVAQGRVAGPSLWETYLADPGTDPDPAAWRTELTRPLTR